MVTASYVSPEMQHLDQGAKDADVLIMNEVGLDPGIDHMSAMKIIDEAKQQGKKVSINTCMLVYRCNLNISPLCIDSIVYLMVWWSACP